ncbi:hypothetical protein MRX96_016132 [Rhipicephalus microplus]
MQSLKKRTATAPRQQGHRASKLSQLGASQQYVPGIASKNCVLHFAVPLRLGFSSNDRSEEEHGTMTQSYRMISSAAHTYSARIHGDVLRETRSYKYRHY